MGNNRSATVFPTPNSLNFSAPVYTVADLITEVRINTKLPNANQISDARILYYLNQFITMDLSQWVQHFAYKSVLIFDLVVGVDKYPFPLNQYISLASDICLVNGYDVSIFTDYIAFNSLWQNQQQNQLVAEGDGTTTTFTFEVFHPAVRGYFDQFGNYLPGVNVVGTTAGGEQLSLWDNGNGQFAGANNNLEAGTGTIDYNTGIVTVTFQLPPVGPIDVSVNTFTYGQPSAVLFYSNTFIFRDVPNRPYNAQFQAYVNPVAYANSSQPVILNNSFKLFVYGTARYILFEYKDLSQVAVLDKLIDEQLRLFKRGTWRMRNQSAVPSGLMGPDSWVPWQTNVPYGPTS